MKTQPPNFLDEMLPLDDAVKYTGLHPETLKKRSRGKRPPIPVVRLFGPNNLRWNPRMIQAQAMHDAGMSYELIAAAFGSAQKRKETA